jgi:UPF0176 protein
MTKNVVAALYKFAPLTGLRQLQAELQEVCDKNGVCGTLLIAHEGVNGTIAGSRTGIDRVLSFLRRQPGLRDLDHKESFADGQPFYRMKVRIKKEIVTMGVDGIDPNDVVGAYVDAADWNKLIAEPGTLVIDTRNDYEVKIGTFKNAVNPHTASFREFPAWAKENVDPKKTKKVAMFCTGGIRCEKASAYMKKLGFEEVYHLKGGILRYLEKIPEAKSLWEGECFVFDQRVAVKNGLAPGSYTLCPSCRHPVSEKDLKSKKYVEGVACPNCYDSLSENRKARSAERHKQVKLAQKRGEKHIGAKYGDESE